MTKAAHLAALTTDEWVSWSPEQKRHLLQAARAESARRRRALWTPYHWQRPHTHPDDWPATAPCDASCDTRPPLPPLQAHEVFAIYGGRGIGKTDGGANYVLDHVAGPPCDTRVPGGHRVAIVAPTIGDAAESCVNGPSGLRAYDPRVQLVGSRGGTFARFPNGSRARLFGAHSPNDVERFRSGGNNCLLWVEEAGAQRYLTDVLDHATFGLRVGPTPHIVLTTTPKPRKELRALIAADTTHVQRGKTRDAFHLASAVRDALERKFAGTRLGRQELDGDELLDVEGAMWTGWLIERGRLGALQEPPPLRKVVVAVDPNAGGPDECGIVVVGVARDLAPDLLGRLQEHYYVLDDLSGRFDSPGQWAAVAVKAYHDWQADYVVAEVNNGGDMVPYTVHTVGPSVPCRSVHATRGKARRAEPVVALYEQDRVHHVGAFPQLEDQMTTWTDAPDDSSPDRMDALVWGVTDLGLPPVAGGTSMFAAV